MMNEMVEVLEIFKSLIGVVSQISRVSATETTPVSLPNDQLEGSLTAEVTHGDTPATEVHEISQLIAECLKKSLVVIQVLLNYKGSKVTLADELATTDVLPCIKYIISSLDTHQHEIDFYLKLIRILNVIAITRIHTIEVRALP